MKISSKILIFLIIMSFPVKHYAQSIKNMHISEIWWTASHPFIAKKAYNISKQARDIANSHISDTTLDGDYNGGMVDAFRHTLWMALLVQDIKPQAAYKLGLAHEKGNYKDYKKKTLEEGSLPDSVSCAMDLKNNSIGLDIGQQYMGVDKDTLIQVVKSHVRRGKCWKIKKNSLGYFLDENDNVIPDTLWKGKWISPKVLVPSNYQPPLN